MGIFDLIFPKKCLECGVFGQYLCQECVKKVPPRGWQQNTYSVFAYEGVIRKAIIALKYKYSTEIAKELAEVCIRKLLTISHWPSAILTPVPLHWHRQNVRGFNQAEEVGKLIAKKIGWQFMPDLLIKKRSTEAQVALKGPARRQNLHGAFALNPIYVLHSTYYILFDDVLTTGSTLLEASKVLRGGGAKRILCLTIAK